MSQLHISVIGAGNMGCLYGANLARAGHRVTFIDPWAEHVEAIGRGGFGWRVFTVRSWCPRRRP